MEEEAKGPEDLVGFSDFYHEDSADLGDWTDNGLWAKLWSYAGHDEFSYYEGNLLGDE